MFSFTMELSMISADWYFLEHFPHASYTAISFHFLRSPLQAESPIITNQYLKQQPFPGTAQLT